MSKEEVKQAIVSSSIAVYGSHPLHEFEEEDFQEICFLTRQYASWCQTDKVIEKEVSVAFLLILQNISGKGFHIQPVYIDQENLKRANDYWSILVNEVYA